MSKGEEKVLEKIVEPVYQKGYEDGFTAALDLVGDSLSTLKISMLESIGKAVKAYPDKVDTEEK